MSTSATSHMEGNAEGANKSYACQHCRKLLLPVMSQRRKVICPRCHGVYCAGCTMERCYGSVTNIVRINTTNVTSISSAVRLCVTCATTPDIVRRLTRNIWCLIIAFCAPQEQQRLLQLCRATQLGVMLPYTYISRGWGALFSARQLVFKGANGAVYETMLRSDLRLETISSGCNSEGGEEVLCGPTIEDFTRLAGRTVAVKTVEKATVYSMKKWSHIEREVSAMRRCRHEHVVPLYFVAQGPSEVYIVMQYVEGGDLFDWLVRQQVPLESDVRLIARQLLTVLHFMHEHCGVVHRDIKPENILLDIGNTADVALTENEQGTTTNVLRLHIRLADFGYAMILPPQPVPAIKENTENTATADENKEEETSTTQTGRAQTRPIRLRPMQQARGETNSTIAQGAREEQNEERLSEESEAMAWRLISTTPCGTLGFAAPEIIRAYNAKKAAMQRPDVVFMTEGEDNQSEARNAREGSNDIVQRRTNTSSTRDSTSASDGASTRIASHVDPQTPIELFKRLDIFAAGVTLCILLTGCEPFPCTSSKEHLRAVLRGMDFSGPEWGYVSKPARRLLRQMLAASAAQRPSALQCLHSPWLRDTRDNSIITVAVNATSEAISTAVLPSQEIKQQTVPTGLECIPELVSQSFRQSVHTLRKNEPWLFVQDVTGQVTALPRHIVTGDEDQQALSQLNLAASNDTFITA